MGLLESTYQWDSLSQKGPHGAHMKDHTGLLESAITAPSPTRAPRRDFNYSRKIARGPLPRFRYFDGYLRSPVERYRLSQVIQTSRLEEGRPMRDLARRLAERTAVEHLRAYCRWNDGNGEFDDATHDELLAIIAEWATDIVAIEETN